MIRLLTWCALAAIAAGAAAGAPQENLAPRQQRLRRRMAGVERRLAELSRLMRADQPERAGLLREAVSLSRERAIVAQMARVRELLARSRYSEARRRQQRLLEDLERLRRALSEEAGGPGVEALRRAADALRDLVERQSAAGELARELAGREEPASAWREAVRRQQRVAELTRQLRERLAGSPAAGRLQDAVESMEEAASALEGRRGAEAASAAERAGEELRRALVSVQEALSRARGRERALLRRKLAQMLTEALQEQAALREGTAETDALARKGELAGRALSLRLAELRRRQEALAERIRTAVEELRGDGTSPALPALLESAGADMEQAAGLLGEGHSGPPVQGAQRSAQATMGSVIEALKSGQAEEYRPRQPRPQRRRQPPEGGPMVDLAAELRVVRAVQQAVLEDTRRLSAAPETAEAGAGSKAEGESLGRRQRAVGTALEGVREILRSGLPLRRTLGKLQQRAEAAAAAVEAGRLDQNVEARQREVVTGLDRLLEALQVRGGLPGEPTGPIRETGRERPGGQPTRAAVESILPRGRWHRGRLRRPVEAEEKWLPGLPTTERARVADTFRTGRLPARYRELLRAYNRRLAEEGH